MKDREEELEDEDETIVDDAADDDLIWDDSDPADRRKDPLRRPEA